MSGTRNDQPEGPKVRRLSDAVRRVRVAEAERMDAFADLHDAEKARLEMLAEELAGVFAEIARDDDYFIVQLTGGSPPRLWIDPTAHVVIGRDRRTYRFLKDTRLGRVVLAETANLQSMADSVTDYMAERVVERDRAKDSDLFLARLRMALLPRGTFDTAAAQPAYASSAAQPAYAPAAAQPAYAPPAHAAVAPSAPPPAAAPVQSVWTPPPAKGESAGIWMLITFLFGVAAGAIGLIAYAWLKLGI